MYTIKDIDLYDFVNEYALRIHDPLTLKYGLLLASGTTFDVAGMLALGNDPDLIEMCDGYLARLGYLRKVKS